MPPAVLFYVTLVLPFLGGDGQPRIENILFWPALAALVLALALANLSRLDKGFIASPPIASLAVYLVFAGASISWALSPENAFSRYMLQLFCIIIILVPYALPISTERTVQHLHLICALGVLVNAYYVLTTPPSPIGHPGFYTHKQELGIFCGGAVILSLHELLIRGWRRWFAAVMLCITFWVMFESQSKSPLAFVLVASTFATFALLACKLLRTTPAFLVGAVVLGFIGLSYVWTDPVGRIAWYIYGDATLTGRTYIWEFINYVISQKSWFGWGFHSYWGVPNSPHEQAPGFIKDMISTHSGYLELKLDTGSIGYWLFLVFIYASLHFLEPVRRKNPIRAWFFVSYVTYILLLNMVETIWMTVGTLWVIYLIVVGESVHIARSADGSAASSRDTADAKRQTALLPRKRAFGGLN